jgi:hypothetical protein
MPQDFAAAAWKLVTGSDWRFANYEEGRTEPRMTLQRQTLNPDD